MKVNWNLTVGPIGCDRSGTIEIDDQILEGLNEAEREKEIELIIEEEIVNHIEWGWSEIE